MPPICMHCAVVMLGGDTGVMMATHRRGLGADDDGLGTDPPVLARCVEEGV